MNVENLPQLSKCTFRAEHLMAILGIARCQLQYAHKTGLLSTTSINAQSQRRYDWPTIVGYKVILLLAEKLKGLPSVRPFVSGIFGATREHPELLSETESTIIVSDGQQTMVVVSNPGAEQRPLPTWPLVELSIAQFHRLARERLQQCAKPPIVYGTLPTKKNRDPVTMANILTYEFHTQEVSVMSDASSRQLRTWDRKNLIRPSSHVKGSLRYYNLTSVILAATAALNSKLRMNMKTVCVILAQLKSILATTAHPLTELYFCTGFEMVRVWHDQSPDVLHNDREPCLHFSIRLWLKNAIQRLRTSKKKFSPRK